MTQTDIRCRVPLLLQAEAILQKYENFPVNRNRAKLLPVHSNQKMNEYLKELADICGIKKSLSMHVARHTFATTVTLLVMGSRSKRFQKCWGILR
jgi:site-specific recombinase XerD